MQAMCPKEGADVDRLPHRWMEAYDDSMIGVASLEFALHMADKDDGGTGRACVSERVHTCVCCRCNNDRHEDGVANQTLH
jgi:hypothetical protein